MSYALQRELAGAIGAGRNLLRGGLLLSAPEIFMQGKPGSLLDRSLQNVPGIVPDPRTDVGRRAGQSIMNELRYVGNQLGTGRIPYMQSIKSPLPPPGQSPGIVPPSLRNFGPEYKERELERGRQAEQFRAGAGFPGQQRTGGAQPPGTGLGNAAVVPTYDMTPQGQFQRYFTDNQMGQYFGGAPSAQAPKSAEAMQEAAMLQKAPTTMPLADYYRSQSATGRANMDQIIGLMGYTGDMEKWARANPMLAQRAFAAQFQGGGPATQGAPGAQPVVDEALNPSSPEFRGVGGTGDRIYNFAADDVDAAKIKAFQELLSKQRQ